MQPTMDPASAEMKSIALRHFLVRWIFHPASETARNLARQLHATLNDDPVLPGLRVATVALPEDGSGFPPSAVDQLAEHEVFVVLADDKMSSEPDTIPSGRRSWADFVVSLAESCGDGRHRFLPIQMTEAAWPLDRRLGQTNALRAYAEAPLWLARRLVIEISRFVMGLERGERVPLRLFLSHAKKDISPGGPFATIVDHLKATQPVQSWIDSAQIEPGTDFAESIRRGIRECQAVLAIVTNHYSTRPWCRREILLAKTLARPLVVADCLDDVDSRSFPYLGNAPTVAWARADAQRVIDILLKEHLRWLMAEKALERLKTPDDVALATAPELATLASLKQGTSVVYPDPPLGDDEMDLLQPLGHRIETPLQRAGQRRPLSGLRVALSISESDDLTTVGAFPEHLGAVLLEISRHLLVRGATLAYGGHLGDAGYTQCLFNLVRSHQASATLPAVERIRNYIGWPLPLTDSERAKYRELAQLIRIQRPNGIEALDPQTFVAEPVYFPASSPERRYAWARGMTLMRERQTSEVVARVALGGTVGPTPKALPTGGIQQSWYSGRIPGVLEESLLSLRAGQPLYVCGGFGGAGQAMAALLEGQPVPRFDWSYQSSAPHSQPMRELYVRCNEPWWDYPEMRSLARQVGVEGLSAINGLSPDQNRELFRTQDADRIVALLLTGLEVVKARLP